MKLQQSGIINAPIEHVHICLTDIKYLKSELKKFASGEDVTLQYDRKNPFAVGNKITFIKDEPVLSFIIEENKPPSNLKMTIKNLNKHSESFGNFFYQAILENHNGKTKYEFVYSSEKELPDTFQKYSWLFRFIAKLFLWQSHRKFVKHVKSTRV
jgi:hypothetical protein